MEPEPCSTSSYFEFEFQEIESYQLYRTVKYREFPADGIEQSGVRKHTRRTVQYSTVPLYSNYALQSPFRQSQNP